MSISHVKVVCCVHYAARNTQWLIYRLCSSNMLSAIKYMKNPWLVGVSENESRRDYFSVSANPHWPDRTFLLFSVEIFTMYNLWKTFFVKNHFIHSGVVQSAFKRHMCVFGWFKRSLNQSIGSFSCNPHFALFQPDWRWDIFQNASDHWGMVTYNFFRNFFFRSLIRASTGSFANVCQALCPISIKLGQILCCQKIGHRP